MASYFSASTSRKRPLRETGYTTQTIQPPRLSDSSLDDSVYVFPNPATAPPSPTQNSDLSAYTEFTTSVTSETIRLPRSRDGRRSLSTSLPRTPLSPWEWVEHLPPEVYYGEIERPDQWRVGRNERTQSVSTYPVDLVPAKVDAPGRCEHPHAPAHIPLLSFFTSLLAIDDSTVCLLRQPSSDSALFACPGLPSDSSLEEADGELHGLEKLLARKSGARRIRDALLYERELGLCRPPSPRPFLGLWNTVSVLVTNSGKALREVLHR